MDPFETFKVPKRPKFKFGEPLEEVYQNSTLHAGLKDLFLKAYLSAKKDEYDDDRPEENTVLLALKAGANGQGSVSQRISLKTRLEKGEWLIPAQTPRGAPLWLLRHFLGRLPQPILQGSQWKALGRACGEAAVATETTELASGPPQELFERIAASTKELSQAESTVFGLLTLLIRKFTAESQSRSEVKDEPSKDDVADALSQYFTASITARPFRPGLHTSSDKECKPLLAFVSKYWDLIFQEIPEATLILDSTSPGREQSYQYFQDEDVGSPAKLIGFEPLAKDVEQKKEEKEEKEEKDEKKRSPAIDAMSTIKQIHMKSLSLEEKFCLQKGKPLVEEEKEEQSQSRFKLSEFLKSTPSLDNSGSSCQPETASDDEDQEDIFVKQEFFSVPNSDDSST